MKYLFLKKVLFILMLFIFLFSIFLFNSLIISWAQVVTEEQRIPTEEIIPDEDHDIPAEEPVLGEENCGNGIIEGVEECDNGKNEDFEGCSSDCIKTPYAEINVSSSPLIKIENVVPGGYSYNEIFYNNNVRPEIKIKNEIFNNLNIFFKIINQEDLNEISPNLYLRYARYTNDVFSGYGNVNFLSGVDQKITQIKIGDELKIKYFDISLKNDIDRKHANGVFNFDLIVKVLDDNGLLIFNREINANSVKTESFWSIGDNDIGGDCYLIGNWDVNSRTCTINNDLNGTLNILNNNLIINGNGKRLIGEGGNANDDRNLRSGIYIGGKENVAIKNLIINSFSRGIDLYNAKNNIIEGNTIDYQDGYPNKIGSYGIYLSTKYATDIYVSNVIKNNFVTNNYIGIRINGGSDNVIDNNIFENNFYGIGDFVGSSNTKILNSVFKNNRNGNIIFFKGDNVLVAGNDFYDSVLGNFLSIFSASGAVYNNNFYITGDPRENTNIVYYESLPVGGNYWQNYDEYSEGCIDDNNDKICDSPKLLQNNQDIFPWTIPNGWKDNDNGIKFFGDEVIILNYKEEFIDPRAEAYSSSGESVPVEVIGVDEVNTNEASTYIIKYQAEIDGEIITKERWVVVKNSRGEFEPFIRYDGEDLVNVNVGDDFNVEDDIQYLTAFGDSLEFNAYMREETNRIYYYERHFDINQPGTYRVKYFVWEWDDLDAIPEWDIVDDMERVIIVNSISNDNPPEIHGYPRTDQNLYHSGMYFQITYTDADNNAPTFVILNVNGVDYTAISSDYGDYRNDEDYVNSEIYHFQVDTPEASVYEYYFKTSDGRYEIQTDLESIKMLEYECADGIDNDGNGKIDMDDYGCKNETDNLESVIYVSLGDSYSAGIGNPPYELFTDIPSITNGCYRSEYAYSQIVSNELGADLTFHACSGAVTRDFYFSRFGKDGLDWGENRQQDYLESTLKDVELVTFTIGGNDIGFADIAMECAKKGFYGFAGYCSEEESVFLPVDSAIYQLAKDEGDGVIYSYEELFKKIKEKAPNAEVVVLGYPYVFPEDSAGIITCSHIKRKDQRWINDVISRLNSIIEAKAKKFNFIYMQPDFKDHELCGVGEDWLYKIDVAWLRSSFDDINYFEGSLHPNFSGHQKIASTVLEALIGKPKKESLIVKLSQTDMYDFVVNPETTILNFLTGWPGSTVVTTLVSPSGVRYNKGTGNLLSYSSGDRWERFEITDPEPGEWQAELFGLDVDPDGEETTISIYQEEPKNQLPVGNISWQIEGDTLVLDASDSYDHDGEIIFYEWYINGVESEELITGEIAQFDLTQQRPLSATLVITDNRDATDFITEHFESIAPTTTITLFGYEFKQDIYLNEVNFTIDAVDNENGVGVKFIKYSLNDDTVLQEYIATTTISTYGNHTIQYYSEDWFGNTEETKIATFRIVTALELLQDAQTRLEESEQANPIKQTLKQLEQALNDKYWQENNTLTKKGGENVFAHLKNAICHLEGIDNMEEIKNKIALAVEILITLEMEEVEGAESNKKNEKALNKANDKMNEYYDEAQNTENALDKIIDLFSKAWHTVMQIKNLLK